MKRKASSTRPTRAAMFAILELFTVFMRRFLAGSGKVEQQDFGVAAAVEAHLATAGDLERIAVRERFTVDRDLAAHHVHVGAPAGSGCVLHRLGSVEERGVDEGILVDRDRPLAPVGRGDEAQPPALGGVVEALLLVPRL